MTQLQALFARYRGLILPVSILACIGVLLVPLPPFVMDILLAVNIAISLIVLLTAIYVRSPIEFSVFPSLLVATTLARLVLNVGTTRLILTHAGERRDLAAGGMISAFGNFVAGEFVIVGVVVFAIIVIIQFLVITKGATRISEVAARFALDGLPGKQMAIDAELNSGTIDDAEARKRREQLAVHADFYGAMDGASKFVRGDAVAGVCITLINIIGGLTIGLFQFQMPLSDAIDVFTRLTIGDGLASQIPAFLISIAAAMLVTRNTHTEDLSNELLRQLFSQPQTLAVAGVFLALLVFTNLPTIPLLLLGSACISLSWLMRRHAHIKVQEEIDAEREAAREQAQRPNSPEQLLLVDPLRIEIGVELLRLADPQRDGDLMERITTVRGTLAREMGFLLPKLRLKDNLELKPTQYQILIGGNVVATGEVLPGHVLVLETQGSTGLDQGLKTTDPIQGRPAVWLNSQAASQLLPEQTRYLTPSQLIANHLEQTARHHASELLSREVTKQLVDELRKVSPAIVEELIPGQLSLSMVQQVLRGLLAEDVPIGQLGLILETCGDCIHRTQDPLVLTQFVRERLSRTICRRFGTTTGRLYAITLDAAVEDRIAEHMEVTDDGVMLRLSPTEITGICEQIEAIRRAAVTNRQFPVLLVRPSIRRAVREMTRSRVLGLPVLSLAEITFETKIISLGQVHSSMTLVGRS